MVTPAGPWTAALWEATGDIWRDILELPFIRGLGDGTLDEDLSASTLTRMRSTLPSILAP